ncbi:MAG: TolC family protein [Gemmatales bacterium]|nr:TolC family protein [Gemmatales bacterium]MDW7993983.1 TolC family protein [Gemmatales bacterium]
MSQPRSARTTYLKNWAAGLAFACGSLGLVLAEEPGRLPIQETREAGPLQGAAAIAETSQAKSEELTLEEAIKLALRKQPNIAAAGASLMAAQIQYEAAYSPFAIFTGPQFVYRRQQATHGLAIAQAGLTQAELETIQAVTRNYLSYLYAREQTAIADETVRSLGVMAELAKKLVDAGSREVTTADLERISTYQLIAQTRLARARLGSEQARAALREAIGLSEKEPLNIAAVSLADYFDSVTQHMRQHKQTISCDKAVELALAHRPEVTQASLLAEVIALEVCAQGWTWRTNALTFAARSDIHAKILPATILDPDYRPGPIGPEMPAVLSGTRRSRQARAAALYQRALAGAEKVEHLVALEVRVLCARLQELEEQVKVLREAAERAAKLRKDAEKAYAADQLNTEKMLTAQLLDAQVRADLNEALYNYCVTLAALQRATASKLWEALVPAP